ncbi:hypothetical protein CHS0354_006751 [Potamilus streckersoni]|uniref:Coiled-coil domain-containing protein 181 n=1 Tax=Potamilus streckersoni TaxID=2493646 RepID=A0AAE0RR92_9BIVA|nr:hypothetical protein CHS0354_006751 [Potamilus streckersoni]
MDYPDEDPPEYNVKERLKELNQELANDPTPVENNREPKVLFKENLVDLVAPPPEYSDDESKSKSPDNIQPKMEEKENSGKKSEKNKSEKSSSNQVLIERSGTFELVNADDVTAQDMGLPTASVEKAKKNSKNKNQKEPRPPSKPRPATAAESSRRNIRSQTSQKRPLSAQSHNSSSEENYNSPYGLSPEQKQLAKQRAEALEKKKKEDEKKKKEEEEEKQRESMEAFQYWLQKKIELEKKMQKEKNEKNKEANTKEDKNDNDEEYAVGKAKDIELINRPDPNALTDEDQHSLLEITEENNNAYKDWLKTKSTQTKKDRLLEKRAQQEMHDGYYIRSRQECDQAFKDWLKHKNAEIRKARALERQKARAIRMAARKSRRSKTLYRAIRENQAFKYVDYYGYRF